LQSGIIIIATLQHETILYTLFRMGRLPKWFVGIRSKRPRTRLISPAIAMRKVIEHWPIASRVNLSDIRSNRRSWLGQAACCIESGIPEHITRMAWNALTNDQKDNANNVAKEVILLWEKEHLV